MGGTDINAPLRHAIHELSPHAKETRIFMLTDGDVNDPSATIKLSDTNKPNVRIFTFGIGNGCNKDMV